jgi:hypothetical protein
MRPFTDFPALGIALAVALCAQPPAVAETTAEDEGDVVVVRRW